MRFPRMTTRRWMIVTAGTSIALWLSVTAYRVKTDGESEWLFHLWERHDSHSPESVFSSSHQAPFWPRYWRRLFGQPWPGTYVCDHSLESESRWGRLATTVTASTAELRGEIKRGNGRPPVFDRWSRSRAEYRNEYVPKHWRKSVDGIWESDY